MIPAASASLGSTSNALLGHYQNSYLLQVSLTILRVVTRRSPYSSLLDAFSTCPSFFSLFSFAFVSRAREPVTVTWWPTCWSNLTLMLRRPQLLPSSPAMENSPGSAPFCKHPVTVLVRPLGFCLASTFRSVPAWAFAPRISARNGWAAAGAGTLPHTKARVVTF